MTARDGGEIDLRCGRWQDVLADVGMVDAVITDPPFGRGTHEGQRHGRKDPRYCDTANHPLLSSRGIEYDHWEPEDVHAFVAHWAPINRGWFACFTSHDLIGAYKDAYEQHGLTTYAPLSCMQLYRNVRLAGDGPASWTDHLCVARPSSLAKWGALPGGYCGMSFDAGENALDRSKRIVAGQKPLWLVRAIVRDYSRPGDLVCDPCAGGATTLLAAAIEGRRAVGSELDPVTFAKAQARIARGYTPATLFAEQPEPEQQELLP